MGLAAAAQPESNGQENGKWKKKIHDECGLSSLYTNVRPGTIMTRKLIILFTLCRFAPVPTASSPNFRPYLLPIGYQSFKITLALKSWPRLMHPIKNSIILESRGLASNCSPGVHLSAKTSIYLKENISARGRVQESLLIKVIHFLILFSLNRILQP